MLEDGFEACKLILMDFEQLKQEFALKADSMEKEEVRSMTYALSQTRFILSKFGRVVTIYEVLYQKYKSVKSHPSKLVDKLKNPLRFRT